MFWKASVLEKTEGNKDFLIVAKLKVIPGKPSVLLYKKWKQKENRTEGNKGTPHKGCYFDLTSVCSLSNILRKWARCLFNGISENKITNLLKFRGTVSFSNLGVLIPIVIQTQLLSK